jgi:hypothetical protein
LIACHPRSTRLRGWQAVRQLLGFGATQEIFGFTPT